jgi:hypothetical protein
MAGNDPTLKVSALAVGPTAGPRIGYQSFDFSTSFKSSPEDFRKTDIFLPDAPSRGFLFEASAASHGPQRGAE